MPFFVRAISRRRELLPECLNTAPGSLPGGLSVVRDTPRAPKTDLKRPRTAPRRSQYGTSLEGPTQSLQRRGSWPL
eukprot:2012050-Pyramimonas_sp.AAC.1